MIISEKLFKECSSLNKDIETILVSNSLTDLQLENFLINFERRRYHILNEIKTYNRNVMYEHEKIKTIDAQYKAEISDNILKIYVPEVMPSYKNLKTHTYKRILLNIAEITKPFKGQFESGIFIYIKIFDNIQGWDIDNKCIKPISDALILSNVITDDNTSKMFYAAKGEFSENPHSEIYVLDSKNMEHFFEDI